MKRKFFSKSLKQTILAVPAAALMLGASHGATVGINYTENFGQHCADGNGSNTGTPDSPSYYVYGYMTTGMNVTAPAFGVPTADWANIQLSYGYAINSTNTVGAMTVITTAEGANCSGIGNTNFVFTDFYSQFVAAVVVPGNDQVTWGYLDDDVTVIPPDYTSISYTLWKVKLSGLRAAYPNGYTIQTIAYPWFFDSTATPPVPAVHVSDLSTFTNTMDYTDLGVRQGAWEDDVSHAGLSSVSSAMTADTVTIYADPPWLYPAGAEAGTKHAESVHSTLCGFIITDASSTPSMSLQVVGNTLVYSGGTLQSSPSVGASAVWTTVPSATSPYQFLPSASPAMFYRLTSSP